MSRSLKTTRNLSQFAEKKLVGKSHTSAQKTDNAEGIPSNIQISTNTIFGEAVPDGPTSAPTETLWAVTSSVVQYVQFDVTEIGLTTYDADSNIDSGGDDSPQNIGPHAWALSLPANYESSSTTGGTKHHTKVGTAPYEDSTRVYDTLGALQLIPTNVYINTSNVASNPYIAKIYVWDGSDASTKETTPLSTAAHVDWFVDYYSGIIFFQEYDGKVPYKVEAFIYVGDMADQTTGSGATTLNGLNDVNAGSPNNNQVLTYNSSSSKWEPQNSSGGGGIERYSKIQTGSSINSGTNITISGMDFSGKSISNTETTLYLNGQQMLGGDSSAFTAGTCDYQFVNNTDVKFTFPIDDGDSISIFHSTTSFSTGKPFLLHTADSAFDDARIITQGTGISITTANPTEFIINNSGLVQRTKVHNVATSNYSGSSGSHSGNQVYSLSFGGSVNFSTPTYSDERIDIFLDGVLLFKGVDYQLADASGETITSSQFRLLNSKTITSGQRVTAIIF